MDPGAGGTVVELEIALEVAAVCPLRVEVELDLVTSAVVERTLASRGPTQTRVVLRICQLNDDQATLVPAGVPEAVFYIVSGIGPGKVRARHGRRSCREVGEERGGRGIFGDMAFLDVVRDLFRMLRIPEVDDADALIGRGVDYQPHIVAIVEIEVMHHPPGGICRDILRAVFRFVYIGLERGNDARVSFVRDVDQT